MIILSKQYVERLISNFRNLGFFIGETISEQILEIDKALKTELPDSYRWFVRNYGYGGISGRCIEGIGKDGSLTVVEVTNQYRARGLPEHLVVVENCDEYVTCLDLTTISNGDCKVVSWSNHDKDGILPQTSSFYDYLLYAFYNEDDMDDDELYSEWLRIFNEIK